MQRLDVSCAVRHIHRVYISLGAKGLKHHTFGAYKKPEEEKNIP
jgi:hypothetical protein